MNRIFLVTLICAMLCACQNSPRKQYFLLNAPTVIPAAELQQQSSQRIITVIGIGPVEIADYLDRMQMVYDQSDNNLHLADNDYWAEPLDKGIARVLTLNLTQRNSQRSFIEFPWRSDSKPQYSLRVHIHALNFNQRHASINATWELFDNNKRINLERQHFTRSIPTQPGSHAMAESYSQLLAALAEQMDHSLQQTR